MIALIHTVVTRRAFVRVALQGHRTCRQDKVAQMPTFFEDHQVARPRYRFGIRTDRSVFSEQLLAT